MVTPTPNPFMLPGFGQAGEMAQNPILASMEMMRKAWEGMAGAGGMDKNFAAAVSPEDLERRISDLRVVENWLRMNLSMLGSTIQALEVQRATISTLKAFVASAGAMSAPGAEATAAQTPSGAAWPATPFSVPRPSGDSSGLFGDGASAGARSDAATLPDAGGADTERDTTAAPALGAPAEAAMHTWWDMLQTQFDNLASAAAATMQSTEAMQEAATEAQKRAVASAQAAVAAAVPGAAGKAPEGNAPAAADARAGRKPAAKKAASPAKKPAKKAAASSEQAPAARKSGSKKTAVKKTAARKAAATRSRTAPET